MTVFMLVRRCMTNECKGVRPYAPTQMTNNKQQMTKNK
jgi:hypothetical protein